MRLFAFAALLLGCSCGAPPIGDESNDPESPESSEPINQNLVEQQGAPLRPIVINLSDNLTDVMLAEIDHFHSVTGIARPDIVTGDCSFAGGGYCITYGTPPTDPTLDAQGIYPWGIVIREAPRASEWNHLLLFHEYAHLFIFPAEGIDGQGHVGDGSVMSARAPEVTCFDGLGSATIEMLCGHRECSNPVAECE